MVIGYLCHTGSGRLFCGKRWKTWTRYIKQLKNKNCSEHGSFRSRTDSGGVGILSEARTNSIIHFERGNGLISTNNNNLIVEFKASALEKDLITTDRKDLQELKDRIQEIWYRCLWQEIV